MRLINADVLDGLAQIESESVQCCVTSPPYWGLRDYGVPGQLGLEPTPEAYVGKMVAVFLEVRRVLRKDGTAWINLGDSYAAERGGTKMPAETLAGGQGGIGPGDSHRGRGSDFQAHRAARGIGLKHKDLVGIPWRVAFALQADGWYLRSDIIWAKPNPMPESVTDRPTKAHEYLFLLAKSQRYFFDQEAVREPGIRYEWPSQQYKCGDLTRHHGSDGNHAMNPDPNAGRNIRSVWTIATEPFPEAHFATFPRKLVEPCVKAGSRPKDTVLDPFMGSGTVGLVCAGLGRDFIGIELNAKYVEMADRRINGPLFAESTP